jgi:hypothetical protein
MASLYQRHDAQSRINSPFWWIKYRDPRTDRIRRESTGFRHSNGADTRRARELEALRTLAERQAVTTNRAEHFSAWVTAFIDDQYAQERQRQSHTRYHAAWRTLRLFLDDRNITSPRQLIYAHCLDYLKWRQHPDHSIGKYSAGHNTAVLELKFLALVIKEAVRRGYAHGNPCRELNLKRAPTRQYAQLSPSDLQLIVNAIAAEPPAKRAFLWPSFLIAHYHGVRLTETLLNPRTAVKLFADQSGQRLGSITFHQKGDKTRVKPLHPELRELLFNHLCRTRARETFPLPKSFAKEWHNFLHRCGLKALKPTACFHSFRVTVQNRLRRAGVPKEIRKAYLSHDRQEDVNARYDRIDAEDFGLADFDMIDEMLQCHAPLNRTWQLPTILQPPLHQTATQTADGALETTSSPAGPPHRQS